MASIKEQLEGMGFAAGHVAQALKATGSSMVETVMEWMLANPYDESQAQSTTVAPAIQPTSMDTSADSVAAPQQEQSGGDASATASSMDTATSEGDGQPTVHNAMCDHCKEQIVGIRYKCAICKDFDLCQNCYPMRLVYHDPDHLLDAHTKDIPISQQNERGPLTPEERAEALKRLEARRLEIRKKKDEEEKIREREREIQRRRGGKETLEAQKQWQDTKMKREAELRKKEKEDDKKARAAAKAKLARYAAERDAKFGKQAAPAPAAKPAAATPSSTTTTATATTPAVPKEYDTCVVQVRLTNGSTLTHEFKPNDSLRVVYNWVAENRTDGAGAFILSTQYPRKDYSGSSLDATTLKSAELVPRGALLLKNA